MKTQLKTRKINFSKSTVKNLENKDILGGCTRCTCDAGYCYIAPATIIILKGPLSYLFNC